jgi:hypothetical protein
MQSNCVEIVPLSPVIVLISFLRLIVACSVTIMVKCDRCKHNISRSEQFLTCSGKCGGSYHITCTDLNDAQHENLKKNGRIETWTCTFCSIVLTASGSDVSNATTLVPGADQVQTVSLTTDKLREIVSDVVMRYSSSRYLTRLIRYSFQLKN